MFGSQVPSDVIRDSMRHSFCAVRATAHAVFEEHRPTTAGLGAEAVLLINGERDRLCFPSAHESAMGALVEAVGAERVKSVVLRGADHRFVFLQQVDDVARALVVLAGWWLRRRIRVRVRRRRRR